MTLGARLRAARKEKKLTQKDLAAQIGAKHNSISNWENDQNRPDPTMLETLCRVLEVTADYLLLGEQAVGPAPVEQHLTDEEWELVGKYRQLDAQARAAVNALMEFAILPQQADALRDSGRRPALDIIAGRISTQSAAAGTGTYLDTDSFETIRLLKNSVTARASFYVPVAGDSMEPRYHDGDVLVIEQAPVHRGEIGIFTLDGRGYVKKLGEGALLSLNAAYDPIPINDDVACNGKVIGTLDPTWIVED